MNESLVGVLATHTIECTGPGEVTCRGCRDAGWMSWHAYRKHVEAAVLTWFATLADDDELIEQVNRSYPGSVYLYSPKHTKPIRDVLRALAAALTEPRP